MTEASAIVFSPMDIQELTQEYLFDRRVAFERGGLEAGLPLYIDRLDEIDDNDGGFVPLQDGDMASIISRPGNGKTSFMVRWARKRAALIRAAAAQNDADAMRRVVVYSTWEQTVEALHSFHIAASNKDLGLSITRMARGIITDEQWQGIEYANIQRIADPLWFIGHSIKRKKKRPTITVSALASALWEIESWQGDNDKFKIDSVFVDYLQRIPYEGKESKTIGISDNLDRLKDAALALGTKVIVGVQAVRDVEKRDDPTPNIDDGQWTSNIEQASDVVLSLMRPSKYSHLTDVPGFNTPIIGKNQMVVAVAKQKIGDSNFKTLVNFDPRYNQLDPLDRTHVNLNE